MPWAVAGFVAGSVVTAFVLGLLGNGDTDPICSLCQDTGNHVIDENRAGPRHKWCFCPLGRVYAALQPPADFETAVARLMQEEEGNQ